LCQKPCHAVAGAMLPPSSAQLHHQGASARGVISPCFERCKDLSDQALIQPFGEQLLVDGCPRVASVSQVGRQELGAGSIIKQSLAGPVSDESLDESLRNVLLLKIGPHLSD